MCSSNVTITNKKWGKKVHISITPKNMILVDVSYMESFALGASAKDDSKLWNMRCGHLNIKGLKISR